MHRRERSTEWMNEAACLGEDPEIFFPVKGGIENAQPAKEICQRCEVRAECLEYAQNSPGFDVVGVWGGLTEKERAKYRRRGRRLGGYATKNA